MMAKTTAQLIDDAVAGQRANWSKYTMSQQRNIFNLLRQASDRFTVSINKHMLEGKIPPRRMVILLAEIKDEMNRLRPQIRNIVRSGQKKSIDFGIMSGIKGFESVASSRMKVGIGTSFIGAGGEVVKFDAKAEKYLDSMWASINKTAMDALIRTEYGGITLSKRIWDVTWPVERQIRNQINLSVLTGEGARELSKRVQSYLGMPTTFRGIALREYHPGAGVYKSAYKNALRLSVSEMNRAYVEGVYRYSMEKDWIVGWDWTTASGNPCSDCLDQEGEFYPKDSPPNIPLHPWCFCWPRPVYREEAGQEQ